MKIFKWISRIPCCFGRHKWSRDTTMLKDGSKVTVSTCKRCGRVVKFMAYIAEITHYPSEPLTYAEMQKIQNYLLEEFEEENEKQHTENIRYQKVLRN